MAGILLAVGLFHVVGIGWGLPGSDGWDTDGIAPRDFLPGLASTLTPGKYYTYPPLHLALLAVLTLPITLVAVARAPSTALGDVVGEIIAVPYMTAMSYVARALALAMSLGIVLFVARIAEELHADALGVAAERPEGAKNGGPIVRSAFVDPRIVRAGWCAAAFAGANAALTYYGKTSNLDVPYLFWAVLAALLVVRAVTRDTPRLLRRAFVFAVLAVGTKDQAYAIFLLSMPIVLGAAALRGGRRWAREIGIAAVLAALLLLFVDGAFFNPSGFRARVGFLLGSASQDYVEYTATWSGRLGVLLDAGRRFDHQYPYPFAIAIVLGIGRALRRAGRSGRALALLPLLAALSFTVTFNWTARRSDPRFLLPQAVFLAVHGGLGLEALVFLERRALRLIGQALVAVAFARAIFVKAAVDANLLLDPRYDTETWLAAHVRPGDTIETYGLNVYLPHFPEGVRVTRIGPEPADRRNPLPGLVEVQAPYEDAPRRAPRFLVVSTGWVWRYLIDPDPALPSGRQIPPTHQRSASEEAPAKFFLAVVGGKHPSFDWAHASEYKAEEHLFPVVDFHGTVARTIWIFERREAPRPAPGP